MSLIELDMTYRGRSAEAGIECNTCTAVMLILGVDIDDQEAVAESRLMLGSIGWEVDHDADHDTCPSCAGNPTPAPGVHRL